MRQWEYSWVSPKENIHVEKQTGPERRHQPTRTPTAGQNSLLFLPLFSVFLLFLLHVATAAGPPVAASTLRVHNFSVGVDDFEPRPVKRTKTNKVGASPGALQALPLGAWHGACSPRDACASRGSATYFYWRFYFQKQLSSAVPSGRYSSGIKGL